MEGYERHWDDCGDDLRSILLDGPDLWFDDYSYVIYDTICSDDESVDISALVHAEEDFTLLRPDDIFLLGSGSEHQPWSFTGCAEQVYFCDDPKAMYLDWGLPSDEQYYCDVLESVVDWSAPLRFLFEDYIVKHFDVDLHVTYVVEWISAG
eukprot:2949912-Pyramimonas_sp.AAC.1